MTKQTRPRCDRVSRTDINKKSCDLESLPEFIQVVITNAASIFKQHFTGLVIQADQSTNVKWYGCMGPRDANAAEDTSISRIIPIVKPDRKPGHADGLQAHQPKQRCIRICTFLSAASFWRATESGSDRSNSYYRYAKTKNNTTKNEKQASKIPAKSRLTNLGLHSRRG